MRCRDRSPGRLLVFVIAIVIVRMATVRILTSGSSKSSAPAVGGGSSTSRQVNVALTAKGCAPEHASYTSGPLTFVVKNTDATAVSEIEVLSQDRILGEKENLAPGFSGTFSIQLSAGTYTVYCPGADTEKNTLTITGTAAPVVSTTHGLLVQGADGYLNYVRTQVSGLTASVATLNRAVQAGNVKAAQVAYAKARPYYERIEPVAESFPALDAAIDLRADDTPITKITGFHRLEYGLFAKKSMTGLGPISTGLVANVKKLSTLVAKLTGFQPAELANGAVGLLDEAAKNKITGEEERYSHIDFVDFAANIEGSQQAFAFLEPGPDQDRPGAHQAHQGRVRRGAEARAGPARSGPAVGLPALLGGAEGRHHRALARSARRVRAAVDGGRQGRQGVTADGMIDYDDGTAPEPGEASTEPGRVRRAHAGPATSARAAGPVRPARYFGPVRPAGYAERLRPARPRRRCRPSTSRRGFLRGAALTGAGVAAVVGRRHRLRNRPGHRIRAATAADHDTVPFYGLAPGRYRHGRPGPGGLRRVRRGRGRRPHVVAADARAVGGRVGPDDHR